MTAVSPPNLPPPPTTTTATTPTYAISFRTPLWLAGPPRNESPARSPRRDIAQNEWGLRSYFQGKPVRSRLTSPPTPPPPPSHQEPPLFLSCWQMKDHFRACSCPMESCLPSALFLLLRERWGGGPILLPWEGGPRKEHSAFVAFSFFFVLFFLVAVGLGSKNWSVDPNPLSWHEPVPGARLRHPLSSPAKELEGWVAGWERGTEMAHSQWRSHRK